MRNHLPLLVLVGGLACESPKRAEAPRASPPASSPQSVDGRQKAEVDGKAASPIVQAGKGDGSRVPGEDSPVIAMHWDNRLGVSELSEVDGAIEKENEDGLVELSSGSGAILVTSCRQWRDLRRQGYFPLSTVEAQSDGVTLLECGTLSLLKRAAPARSSHLGGLAWDEHMLDVLPPALGFQATEERDAAASKAAREGKSWRQFDSKAQVDGDSVARRLTVIGGGRKMTTQVSATAWADFNQDGLEDVVLYVKSTEADGSYAGYRLFLMTRRSADGLLEVLEEWKPDAAAEHD